MKPARKSTRREPLPPPLEIVRKAHAAIERISREPNPKLVDLVMASALLARGSDLLDRVICAHARTLAKRVPKREAGTWKARLKRVLLEPAPRAFGRKGA